MVDWKELGKKAINVTRDVTEKGIDSFQEWKDDADWVAKAEGKKALKRAKRDIERAEKVQKKEIKRGRSKPEHDYSSTEKTFEPFSSKGVVEESTYKKIKRVKLSKITQEEPNRISIKQGRKKIDFLLKKIEFSDKKIQLVAHYSVLQLLELLVLLLVARWTQVKSMQTYMFVH